MFQDIELTGMGLNKWAHLRLSDAKTKILALPATTGVTIYRSLNGGVSLSNYTHSASVFGLTVNANLSNIITHLNLTRIRSIDSGASFAALGDFESLGTQGAYSNNGLNYFLTRNNSTTCMIGAGSSSAPPVTRTLATAFGSNARYSNFASYAGYIDINGMIKIISGVAAAYTIAFPALTVYTAMDMSDNSMIYAVTSTGRLFRSVDSGATVVEITTMPNYLTAVYKRCFCSANGTRILLATTTNIILSVDSGATWQDVTPSGFSDGAFTVNRAITAILYTLSFNINNEYIKMRLLG
jgi:hypothetical protein